MRKVTMVDGTPHVRVQYTQACSGCMEYGEYGTVLTGSWDAKRNMHIGLGCCECGYHGVRRMRSLVPVDVACG